MMIIYYQIQQQLLLLNVQEDQFMLIQIHYTTNEDEPIVTDPLTNDEDSEKSTININ